MAARRGTRTAPVDASTTALAAVATAPAGGDRTLDYDTHGWPTENLEVTLAYNGATRVVQFERGSAKLTVVGSTSGWIETE